MVTIWLIIEKKKLKTRFPNSVEKDYASPKTFRDKNALYCTCCYCK